MKDLSKDDKFMFMPSKFDVLYDGRTLHRIVALQRIQSDLASVEDVEVGELGGCLSTEDNLSQEGTCWVGEDSIVCDHARVRGSARVCGNAVLVDEVSVGNDVIVDSVRLDHDVMLSGKIQVVGRPSPYVALLSSRR